MGLTMGSATQHTPFELRDGAHSTTFRWVRFRSRGPSSGTSATTPGHWRDRVVNRTANAHGIAWLDCEFEYTGDPHGTTFNIWWDARAGGGNIYDLSGSAARSAQGTRPVNTAQDRWACSSSRRRRSTRATGRAPGGVISTNFKFDLSKVTHGSGRAAIGGSHGYGFRIWDSDFVGPATFASFDLCDYVRAWAMVTYRLTCPGKVTPPCGRRTGSRDHEGCRPPAGLDVRQLHQECGRDVTVYRVLAKRGTSTYHVRPIVLTHDRQLYGLSSPEVTCGSGR